jgi:hypothetical protein
MIKINVVHVLWGKEMVVDLHPAIEERFVEEIKRKG